MVDHDASFKYFNTKANRVYHDYYGAFRLVGDGKVSGSSCGVFRSIDGCDHVDLHKGKKWKGKDCSGKVYVRKIYWSCKRSSCSMCFMYGWVKRQAGNIEARLFGVAKKHGLKIEDIEHIIVSLPKTDYELGIRDYKALRLRVMRILKNCGIIGGGMIFHAYRLDKTVNPYKWYASPHFHVLGFVLGGYDRCRHCTGGDCYACDGALGRFYRNYRSDSISKGYVVAVKGKREKSHYEDKPNVFGTAHYQLSHSSYKLGVNRFHICTWFGICGHRVFKSPSVVRKKRECPICKYDVVKLVYMGRMLYLEKWRREKVSSGESNELLLPYIEDGHVAWAVDGIKNRKKRSHVK